MFDVIKNKKNFVVLQKSCTFALAKQRWRRSSVGRAED